ncbi:hypothetical protein [Sulfurimonas marina]|uniref:Uncharacterized protein n=1 Tax=Sulfurimonas marina TaxID=2590551 RepID=A0A7M1ASX4_9BACT|nr:hypothetical protein [Sulfurimonas marina]QOP40517.1 hypothetical protein FJR03_01670 [Sulfurimonas marina]
MSLDLSVRYYSESKIDTSKYKGADLGEYFDEYDEEDYLDEHSVSVDYRLVISAIEEESRLMCMQLNVSSILSILTCFEGWSGFNGESYVISNTGNELVFEKGFDETEVVAQLKEKDLQRYKDDVHRSYDELEKYLQRDRSNYIANKNFVILEMLKDLLIHKDSQIYADFD